MKINIFHLLILVPSFFFNAFSMEKNQISDEAKAQFERVIDSDNREKLEQLIANGASPLCTIDMHDNTLLHTAVKYNRLRVLPTLIACMKDAALINAYNNPNFLGGGLTAVHMAIEKGHINALKLLLEAGADPNTPAIGELYNGWTPLHFASHELYDGKSNVETVVLLLKSGARPNNCTKRGETPLHFVAKTPVGYFVTLLLKAGAITNVRDIRGSTPLHYAVDRRQVNVVEELLKADEIQVDAHDEDGKTAWQIAKHNKDYANLYLLEKAGCKTDEKKAN